MAETSTIFGFMKYVSATDILSDFKKTVDSHFVNSLNKSMEEHGFVFFTDRWRIGKERRFYEGTDNPARVCELWSGSGGADEIQGSGCTLQCHR